MTLPPAPPARHLVRIGRDATVYYSAWITGPTLEEIKAGLHRTGLDLPLHPDITWTQDYVEPFDNVEVCTITPGQGPDHVWTPDSGWETEGSLNLPALEELAQFLEAGAPEVVFTMNYSLETRDNLNIELPTSQLAHQLAIKPDCGTVCCIAGYVAQQIGADDDVGMGAMFRQVADHLGISTTESKCPSMVNDLFDPHLAPDECTPAQAAVAVRRVMKGLEPWTT